jgi:predicted TIM-barrel fold metal-dependent hydrolase
VSSVNRPDALVVVDADTHISEPHDLWTSRAPASMRDLMPQVRRNDLGIDKWFVDGGQEMGNAGGASVINADGSKDPFWNIDIQAGPGVEDIHPGSYDVQARLQVMDEQGVYAHIVYPNALGFAAGSILRLQNRDLSRAVIEIYNDAMGEWQAASGGRLLPQAMLPFWDIDATVAEIVRARSDLRLTGVTMSGEPFNAGLPDLADPHWDPMWEVCTDLELPINIHIGSGGGGPEAIRSSMFGRVWPTQDQYRTYVLGCVQLELGNSNFLSNLVTSDLLVRWPQLKFVSVESGIGWIPYVLERIDFQLGEPVPGGVDLKDRPSARELFRRNVYACFWFEQSGPQHLLEDLGVENVMFESDFPHPTCLYPNPVESALEQLEVGGHSEDVIRKVMGGNAIDLYKIEVSASA